MTIKKNFSFIPNSSTGIKNRLSQQAEDKFNVVNYNYMDSYAKGNRQAYSNVNYQDQRLRNLANYNTDAKEFDYTTSKFNGNKINKKTMSSK